MTWKNSAKSALRTLGLDVQRTKPIEIEIEMAARQVARHYKALPDGLEKDFLRVAFATLFESRAQIHQDAFVLALYGGRRDGFFCEFGATNGVDLSNTWLLETSYGWRGVLGEPGRRWHEALRRNRPRAAIETRCVWSRGGEELDFREADEGELSTIEAYAGTDHHRGRRRHSETYKIATISLAEMLEAHDAPALVDYLSIDTEGSEYEILSAHDFDRYRFGAITVEHNFQPVRARLHALLTAQGYTRVLENWSRWDDWYVHRDVQCGRA